MIEVKYDGSYPNACSGTLIILENGKEIYNKNFCCSSTGRVCRDDDWNMWTADGELTWDDADKFSCEVQSKVKDVLSEVHVCCGGCI